MKADVLMLLLGESLTRETTVADPYGEEIRFI